MIRIGIALKFGDFPLWLKNEVQARDADFLEVDATEPLLQRKPPLRARAIIGKRPVFLAIGKSLFAKPRDAPLEPEVLLERLQILTETAARWSVKGIILKSVPTLSELAEWASAQKSRAPELALYFDPGEAALEAKSSLEIPAHWSVVADPLLSPAQKPQIPQVLKGESLAPYFRIHGYHPERWVRRYSEAQLRGLLRWAAATARHSSEGVWICLAHSQRFSQCVELKTLLGERSLEG
jgi:hypothetical protein